MKEIKKLQRKLLLKNYGILSFSILWTVSLAQITVNTLEKWHIILLNINEFSDKYNKYGRSILLILLLGLL